MPSKLVHRKNLMPLSRENGTLIVATGDPYDCMPWTNCKRLTGLEVRPVLANPREIARLIKQHFGVGGETVTPADGRSGEDVELLEGLEADDSELAKQAQEASVVKLVNEILIEAANERASDIHIEPEETRLRIRYRIDGLLQTQMLPPEIKRFQRRASSAASRSCPGSISPKNACRRTAASRCACRAAKSTSRVDHPDGPRRRHRHASARQGAHGLQPRQRRHARRIFTRRSSS